MRRLNGPHLFERAFERFEVGPSVPVVRAEAAQIDVGQEQDAVRLDQKAAVAASVARGVNHPHRNAAAQVEQIPLAKGHGVRPWLVEERLPQVPAVLLAARGLDAEDVQEAVEVEQTRQVLFVDVDRRIPEQRQRRRVVFVAVAEQHEVDARQRAPAARPNAERGVDQHRRPGAFHQQGVVVGVLAPAFAEEDGRGAEPAVFERSHLAWPRISRPTLRRPTPAGTASRCGIRLAAARSPRRRPRPVPPRGPSRPGDRSGTRCSPGGR